MDPWNDFNDLQLNVPDCSQLDSLVSVCRKAYNRLALYFQSHPKGSQVS